MGRGLKIGMSMAALAVVAIAVALAPATSGAAKKSPFKPGLYVGKTSQGYPVKLRLTVGVEEACDGNPCLFAPNDNAEIYIAIPCPAIEEATNEYMDLPADKVNPNGTVNADENGFSKLVATLKVGHNGTLTGKARATQTLEDGTKCDSGNVTLSAKIGGTTK
jgi:hypothetical protein